MPRKNAFVSMSYASEALACRLQRLAVQSNLSSVRHVSLPAIPSSVSSPFQIRKASRGQEPVEPFVLPEADGAAAAGQRAGMTPFRLQKTGEAPAAETTRSEAARADAGAARDTKGEDPATAGDAAALSPSAVAAPQPLAEAALQAIRVPAAAGPGEAVTEAGGEADSTVTVAGVRAGDPPQRPADILALQAGLGPEDASAADDDAAGRTVASRTGDAAEKLPTDGADAPVRAGAGRPEEFPGRIGLGAARAAEAGQGRAPGDPWARAAIPQATPETAAVPGGVVAQPSPPSQAQAAHDPGKPTALEVSGRQATGATLPVSGAGAKHPMAEALAATAATADASADAVTEAGSGASPVVGKPDTAGLTAAGGAREAGEHVALKPVDADAVEPKPSDLKMATSPAGVGTAGESLAGDRLAGDRLAREGSTEEASVPELRPGHAKHAEQLAHHEQAGRQERAAQADAQQAQSRLAGDEREATARPEAAMPNSAVEPAGAKDGATPGSPFGPLPRHAELPAPAQHSGAPHQMAELPRAVPPSALPIEIGLRALQGAREFQIRLDPAELGKVEVRLEISDDKTVTARVVVDRVETMHLLQRDARTLERAFEQAGLKTSDGGVDISLRDQAQQGRDGRSERDAQGDRSERAGVAPAEPVIDPRLAPLIRRAVHRGALDLTI